MENRLKERLTGAAILVALIVLVVPEMFRGPGAPTVPMGSAGAAGPAGAARSASASAAIGAAAAGAADAAAEGAAAASAEGGTDGTADVPPLRSYTIDLTRSDAPVSAQVSAPLSAQVSPASSVSPVSPSPSRVIGAAATAPAPTGSGPAPRPSVTVHQRGAVAADDARPAAAVPAPASGRWGVQLGLFANGQNAQRLMRSARAKGFSVRISRSGPKELYRVWIAGLADRPAAEQMLRKLHAAGLPAALIRPR